MPKDSTAWYYAEENRLFLFIQSSEDISMTGLAKKIIRYANSTHNLQLSSNVQSSLRTYFFNHHDLANLQLWYKQFPEELQVLKTTNPSFYYRTKAYLNEYDNKIDSAKINWKLGGYNENANSHLNFMYYKRLGEFEERIGDSTQAEGSFEKALSFALQNNSYINQIAMSEKIAKYYQKKGNIDLSLKNLQIANQSKSNWIKTLSDDNIKNIELSNILAQNELEHDKSQEALERKHFTQYLIISLFILLLIMIMIGVSFYNIPSWWIKSMGYISFLMFFESIILLVDHKLHELTNGSPIIILVVKMIILSFMFPTHHWIEQRFVTILLKGDIKRRVHWFFSLFKKKKNISLSE
jgi:tetratricopeptide (TPR) repeat protein